MPGVNKVNVALVLDHPTSGQAIRVIAASPDGQTDGAAQVAAVLAQCKAHMPAYMVPAGIAFVAGRCRATRNGKIDRKGVAAGDAALALMLPLTCGDPAPW